MPPRVVRQRGQCEVAFRAHAGRVILVRGAEPDFAGATRPLSPAQRRQMGTLCFSPFTISVNRISEGAWQ